MNKSKDERVVLFVKLVDGVQLDAKLLARLKSEIASSLSKRHVPSKVIPCPEIPVRCSPSLGRPPLLICIQQYTHTLKRVEVAVKKLINGAKLESINTSAIANPECLRFFVDHPDLRDVNDVRAKL